MIPDAFQTFYYSQYGTRWEGLLHALMQAPFRCMRLNGFSGCKVSEEEERLSEMPHCIYPSNDFEPSLQPSGVMDYYRMDPASVIPALALDVKEGDRVKMSPMWKHKEAVGVVKQVRKDGYVVVVWDGINGEWHWTKEQSLKLEVINERR